MMNPFKEGSADKQFASNALEATIHVGIVLLLLFWCFKIAQPFIEIFFWGYYHCRLPFSPHIN